MNSEHLFKKSVWYSIVKRYVGFFHSVYYQEIRVSNSENIPLNGPVIFTSNHQNALMDALAVVFASKKQPVYFARADIFQKEWIKKILTFFKIVPVYRIRDGFDSIENNEESFDIACKVLEKGFSVGIMPEGNHGEQKRLRPLKKGFARIAFQSQEIMGSATSVKIVPVGLEYSNYRSFRSKLFVNFGKPIDVTEYQEAYKENQAKALQLLKDDLEKALRGLMIDIHSEEHYSLIEELKKLYSSALDPETPYDEQVATEKKLTDALCNYLPSKPEEVAGIQDYLNEINDLSKKLGIQPWVLNWKQPQKFVDWFLDVSRLVCFLPVFFVAALFNGLPFFTSYLVARKVKDPQFVSSVQFVFSMVLFTLWYLIILVLPISLVSKAVFIVLVPLLGLLASDYYDALMKGFVKLKYLLLLRQNNRTLVYLKAKNTEVMNWLNTRLRN